MAVSFINTSKPYAYAGICPGLQTLVGGLAILKNLAGLIQDIAMMCFYNSGAEQTNKKLDEIITNENLNLQGLAQLKATYENRPKAGSGYDAKSRLAFTQGVEKQILNAVKHLPIDFNRSPVDTIETIDGDLLTITKTEVYIELLLKKAEQYHTNKKTYAELSKVTPALERFSNLFVATMTAVPIVGTIYSITSLCLSP